MGQEQPPQKSSKNARMDFRVEIPLLVKYRIAIPQPDGTYQLSPMFNGVGVDFSGGGSAFMIGKDIPKGYFLYIELHFPFDTNPVMVIGEVIRTKPNMLKGKNVFICITQYLLIGPDVQDRMVGFFIGEMARQGKK
jgi:hypothetical protein